MDIPAVILIVLDTMRNDVLDDHSSGPSTPSINEFSSKATVFRRTVSPAPWTLPSHASIFTGKYPSTHGIHQTYEIKSDELIMHPIRDYPEKLLTEHLHKIGFNCIGVSANSFISNGSGFERGFDYFRDVPYNGVDSSELESLRREIQAELDAKFDISLIRAAAQLVYKGKIPSLARLYKRYREVSKRIELSGYPIQKGGGEIVRMIENGTFETPLFFFANLMEMHDPYLRSETGNIFSIDSNNMMLSDLLHISKIPEAKMKRIRDAYYSRASVIDIHFGNIMNDLKRLGLYDKSLIIATSDHGQSLHENGFYGHGIYLYDELIRVPLIIKFPEGLEPDMTQGYMSSTSIGDIIMRTIEGEKGVENLLYDTVFSEDYGIQHGLQNIMANANLEAVARRQEIDVPRKAVFKGDYKLVINGASGEVEEFTFNGKKADSVKYRTVLQDLSEELEIFKGREKFQLADY